MQVYKITVSGLWVGWGLVETLTFVHPDLSRSLFVQSDCEPSQGEGEGGGAAQDADCWPGEIHWISTRYPCTLAHYATRQPTHNTAQHNTTQQTHHKSNKSLLFINIQSIKLKNPSQHNTHTHTQNTTQHSHSLSVSANNVHVALLAAIATISFSLSLHFCRLSASLYINYISLLSVKQNPISHFI